LFFRHKFSALFLGGAFLLFIFSFGGCNTNSAVQSIIVSPESAALAVGGTQQFTAVGRTATGSLVTISPTWSTAGGVGTVSSAGLFSATSLGDGFVYATDSGVVGSASVAVTDKGTISGTVKNAEGTAISGITVRLVSDASKSASTSSSGSYTLSDLTPGTLAVEALETLVYLISTQEVTVAAGETTTCNFTLYPRVSIVSQNISQTGYTVTIVGVVKNNGERTVSGVVVTYVFYNILDYPLGGGTASLGSMTAGETKDFTILVTLSEDSYSRYTATAVATSY
jgi:hypothetical protein